MKPTESSSLTSSDAPQPNLPPVDPASTNSKAAPSLTKLTSRSANSGGSALWIDIEGANLGGQGWKAELKPVQGTPGSAITLTTQSIALTAGRLLVAAGTSLAQGAYQLVVSNAYGDASGMVTTLKGDTGAQGVPGAAGPGYSPWTPIQEAAVGYLEIVTSQAINSRPYPKAAKAFFPKLLIPTADVSKYSDPDHCEYRLAFFGKTYISGYSSVQDLANMGYGAILHPPKALQVKGSGTSRKVETLTFNLEGGDQLVSGGPLGDFIELAVILGQPTFPDGTGYSNSGLSHYAIKADSTAPYGLTAVYRDYQTNGQSANFYRLEARCLPK